MLSTLVFTMILLSSPTTLVVLIISLQPTRFPQHSQTLLLLMSMMISVVMYVVLANNELLLKRTDLHANGDKISSISKKQPHISKYVSKVDNNAHYSKTNNMNGNEGECNMVADHRHVLSTTCSSEDDNVSQDTNGVAVATSASKGSQALNCKGKIAADPQSLYARKRIEKINERLRILQNLVPNGTKVDISTMLEEDVHYVKFLQLQIKVTEEKCI
ncbi:hypothetical protein V6N13_001499 [Hibiscus sabdariffa]|uniref:BHLH domain-containing protein n=1 Tax=Hibiscus sabdariffa TaxID=183260 RepID=A0ABR2G8U3_9ROSI